LTQIGVVDDDIRAARWSAAETFGSICGVELGMWIESGSDVVCRIQVNWISSGRPAEYVFMAVGIDCCRKPGRGSPKRWRDQ